MKIKRVEFAVALVKKDLKMTDLAKLSGVSMATLSAVKNGKSCSKQTARKLTKILGEEILQDYLED